LTFGLPLISSPHWACIVRSARSGLVCPIGADERWKSFSAMCATTRVETLLHPCGCRRHWAFRQEWNGRSPRKRNFIAGSRPSTHQSSSGCARMMYRYWIRMDRSNSLRSARSTTSVTGGCRFAQSRRSGRSSGGGTLPPRPSFVVVTAGQTIRPAVDASSFSRRNMDLSYLPMLGRILKSRRGASCDRSRRLQGRPSTRRSRSYPSHPRPIFAAVWSGSEYE